MPSKKNPKQPKTPVEPPEGAGTPPPPAPPPPSVASQQPPEQHRDSVVQADELRQQDQRSRHEELRMNMMRSVVTEPLLSKVQAAAPKDKFEVIIALNELSQGGIGAALEYVKKQVDAWGVRYATVSQYVFACLTREQILALAEKARALTKEYGPRASAVYRIWEDSDVSVSLTRSLVTVKADAAQRAFQARGTEIVWAVLDSGIQGDHPHFKSAASPFGVVETLAIPDPLEHWTSRRSRMAPFRTSSDMAPTSPVSSPDIGSPGIRRKSRGGSRGGN